MNHPNGSNCIHGHEQGDVGDELYDDHRTASLSIAAIERFAATPHVPWFLAVGFVRPHLPFNCPKRFWDATPVPGLPSHSFGPRSSSMMNQTNSTNPGFGELGGFLTYDRNALNHAHGLAGNLSRAYSSCVSFIDFEFGRVAQALTESGQDGCTVLAVLSDHGWKLGDFGMWGKHSTLHADIHVPLVIRAPDMASPGAASHAVVELVDLFPTLVALAAPSASDVPLFDGQSLAHIVTTNASARPPRKNFAAALYSSEGQRYGSACTMHTVVDENYVLTRWSDNRRGRHLRRCKGVDSVDLHAIGDLTDHFDVERSTNLFGTHISEEAATVRNAMHSILRDFQLTHAAQVSTHAAQTSPAAKQKRQFEARQKQIPPHHAHPTGS
jgi:arylsulfatase A-like enzyme